MKKLLILSIAVLTLVISLCISAAAMATTIAVNDRIKLIAYNGLRSADIMTYAISSSKDGPLVGTSDTHCIQENVYIWQGELFLVKDMSGSVGPSFCSSMFTPWDIDLTSYKENSSLHHFGGTHAHNRVDRQKGGVQNQLYNQDPETATMILLGFGLVGMAGLRRITKE